jgi:hypothetical protein
VEFHKDKAPAPLPPDIGKYKCYVLEDDIMQDLMDVKAGVAFPLCHSLYLSCRVTVSCVDKTGML